MLKSWKWYLDPSVDWQLQRFVLSHNWKRIWYLDELVVQNSPLPKPFPVNDDRADIYLIPMIHLKRYTEAVPFLQLTLELDLSTFERYVKNHADDNNNTTLPHRDLIIDLLREREYNKTASTWKSFRFEPIERPSSVQDWMTEREKSCSTLRFCENAVIPLGNSDIFLDMAARRFLTKYDVVGSLCQISFSGGCVIGQQVSTETLLTLPKAILPESELPAHYNVCESICRNGNRCKRKIDFSKDERLCGRHRKKQKTADTDDDVTFFNWPYSTATLVITLPECVDDWRLRLENEVSIVCLKTKTDCQTKTYDELLRTRFVVVSYTLFPEFAPDSSKPTSIINQILHPRKKLKMTHLDYIWGLTHWHRIIVDRLVNLTKLTVPKEWNTNRHKWVFMETPPCNDMNAVLTFLSNRSFCPCTDELKTFVQNQLLYWNPYTESQQKTMTFRLKMTEEERLLYAQAIGQGQPNHYLRQLCTLPDMNYAKQLNITTVEKFTRNIIRPRQQLYRQLSMEMGQIDDNTELESKQRQLLSQSLFLESVIHKLSSMSKGLHNKEEQQPQTCCICLESIRDDNMGITTCGHLYCYSPCLMKLVNMTSKCAHCKERIDNDSIYLIRIENEKEEEQQLSASITRTEDEFLRNAIQQYGTKMGWLLHLIRDKKAIVIHIDSSTTTSYRSGIERIFKASNRPVPISWPIKQRTQSRVINQFNATKESVLLLDHTKRLYRLRELQTDIVVFLTPTNHQYQSWIDGSILNNIQKSHVKIITYLSIKDTVEDDDNIV